MQAPSNYELIHHSPRWHRHPCAATAAIKGVFILETVQLPDGSGFQLNLLSVAWDQRLLEWKVHFPSIPDELQSEIERACTFTTQQSLKQALSQIKPYQNKYEYFYQYPSQMQQLAHAFPPFEESALQSRGIKFDVEQGIVVYISEVASFSLLQTSWKLDSRDWLCAVIGEGFQIIRIN